MRKNSARKWLHATLDLLPVVIIPIFALYATNKNATFTQEITVNENMVVDFNQHIQNGNFNSNSGWNKTLNTATNTLTINTNENYLHFELGSVIYNNYLDGVNTTSPQDTTSHQWLCSLYARGTTGLSLGGDVVNRYADFGVLNDNFTLYQKVFISSPQSTTFIAIYGGTDGAYFDLKNVMLFDLTQMFGVGNEPTIEQFNLWFPNDYYDYTLSDKQLLKDYDQITYNDTDIGSQFIYGLYNSVDKYFNIGNVFNLGSIYDWLNLNIFNGNSPIAIYIVWNIVAYEFLMDLLFLLYGLFMFFIDTCTNLMDRFYCNLSGRR